MPSAPAAVPWVQAEVAAADWTARVLGEGGQFKKEILGQVSGSDEA